MHLNLYLFFCRHALCTRVVCTPLLKNVALLVRGVEGQDMWFCKDDTFRGLCGDGGLQLPHVNKIILGHHDDLEATLYCCLYQPNIIVLGVDVGVLE